MQLNNIKMQIGYEINTSEKQNKKATFTDTSSKLYDRYITVK